MSEHNLILAVGRLERALSRIEQHQCPEATTTATDDGLMLKHRNLQTAASAAIAEIDNLIAEATHDG